MVSAKKWLFWSYECNSCFIYDLILIKRADNLFFHKILDLFLNWPYLISGSRVMAPSLIWFQPNFYTTCITITSWLFFLNWPHRVMGSRVMAPDRLKINFFCLVELIFSWTLNRIYLHIPWSSLKLGHLGLKSRSVGLKVKKTLVSMLRPYCSMDSHESWLECSFY